MTNNYRPLFTLKVNDGTLFYAGRNIDDLALELLATLRIAARIELTVWDGREEQVFTWVCQSGEKK